MSLNPSQLISNPGHWQLYYFIFTKIGRDSVSLFQCLMCLYLPSPFHMPVVLPGWILIEPMWHREPACSESRPTNCWGQFEYFATKKKYYTLKNLENSSWGSSISPEGGLVCLQLWPWSSLQEPAQEKIITFCAKCVFLKQYSLNLC